MNAARLTGLLIAGLAFAGAADAARAQERRAGIGYEQQQRAPSRQTFEGTVDRVEGRDVIVRMGNAELRTFRMDRDSEIIVNGRWTDLDDLQRGDRVRVTTSRDVGWYASRNIDPFIREIETLRTMDDSRQRRGLRSPDHDFEPIRRERGRYDAGYRNERDRYGERRQDRPSGLGVVLESAANHDGVLVTEVYRDSPADHAGIRRGDFILSVDAMEVDSPDQLVRLIRRRQPGTEVWVTIARDGEERTVTPVLSTRTDALSEREMRRQEEQFARDRLRADPMTPRQEPGGPLYLGGYGPPTYERDGRYRVWRPQDRRAWRSDRSPARRSEDFDRGVQRRDSGWY